MSAYVSPASPKFTVEDGFVIASWKNLSVVSDASRTTPANLRRVTASAVPVGDTAADVTFAFVLA